MQKHLAKVKRNQKHIINKKIHYDYEIISDKIFDLVSRSNDEFYDLTNSWYIEELINYDKKNKPKLQKLTRITNIFTDKNIDLYPLNHSIAKDYSIV